MIQKVVKIVKKGQDDDDIEFWASQGYLKRIQTLEQIRAEYHGLEPRLQRVFKIVKRASS